MRSAPSTLVSKPPGDRAEVVAEVIHPDGSVERCDQIPTRPALRSVLAPALRSVPAPALRSIPAPASSSYRIPRREPPPPPPPAPRAHRLSKKKAAVLADKQAKREIKKNRKVPPRNRRFCRICNVSCNSAKVFYDHINSRGHRVQAENAKKTPYCAVCKRTFESHTHLERHKNGAAHFKVISRNSENIV